VNPERGFACTDCGNVTFRGHCDGEVIRWCNREGELEEKNCEADHQVCGFLNEEQGNWCVSEAQEAPEPIPASDENADADADGITDHIDRCSGTPAGSNVWTWGEYIGCAEGQYRD
jgi:hypothetical protein